MLDRSAAQRARIDAHAVDKHERVIAFGAAQEQRRRLAWPAIATQIDAGFEPEQFTEVVRE